MSIASKDPVLCWGCQYNHTVGCVARSCPKGNWMQLIYSTSTKDAVRCRDCIYYKQDPEPIDPGWPMMCERTGDDMVPPDGFCAWGEMRIWR